MEIQIDKQLFLTYSEIRLGVLHFHAEVKESDNAFWTYMNNEIIPQVKNKIEGKEWLST